MISLLRQLFGLPWVVSVLEKEVARMSQELDDLRTAVAENKVVVESAVQLIEGIADRIAAAIEQADADESNEPLEILAEEIRSQSRALADAVAEGTQSGGRNPQSGAATSAGGPDDSPIAGTAGPVSS